MTMELWLVRKKDIVGATYPHMVFLTQQIAHDYIMRQPPLNEGPQECRGKLFEGATRIRYNGYVLDLINFPVPEGMDLNTERPTRRMGEFLQTINATIATIE